MATAYVAARKAAAAIMIVDNLRIETPPVYPAHPAAYSGCRETGYDFFSRM